MAIYDEAGPIVAIVVWGLVIADLGGWFSAVDWRKHLPSLGFAWYMLGVPGGFFGLAAIVHWLHGPKFLEWLFVAAQVLSWAIWGLFLAMISWSRLRSSGNRVDGYDSDDVPGWSGG